ncbi:MAG: response regulator transcription factor [Bacillota bacterium]
MLKVLIVDDDIFVYTNLRQLIEWEKEGFHLCDAAIGGSDAVRIMAEERPDIIITDMNMPGMDGVALIEYIQKNYSKAKIIALSAYDDFDYVKQSLKKGAFDYILKHTLTPDALLGILRALKEAIFQEKQETEEYQKINEQIQTGKSVLKQNFIRLMVREGVKDRDEAVRKIESLDLGIGLRNLVVVAGEIDDFGLLKEKYTVSEIDNLLRSLVNISTEILKDMENSLMSLVEDGKFVIIFSFRNQHSGQTIYNNVFTALTRVKTTMKRYLNLTACFALDGICPDIGEIGQYYRRAERLLAKKFYEGKDKIIYEPSLGEVDQNIHLVGIKEEKDILGLLKSCQREKLKDYIGQIFDKIQHYQPHHSAAKIAFVTLLNIANKTAGESGINRAAIYGDDRDPYDTLEKFDTVQEIREWILAIYDRLIHSLELFRLNPEYDEVTSKAIDYIFRNYKTEISLLDIADHIGVNSSYLSRKFKKDCGMGVSEYLTFVRLEQAKTLMRNDCKKVKEIAAEVGFNNYNYFFKVFKDNEGMTPLEYEKSCRD